MMRKMAILGLALFVAAPSWAGNGNMLHGFGAVNSSMGGAGAGLWVDDPVGALMFNPALISQSDGNHVFFGTEFFKDGVGIDVTLANGITGTADPSSQLGILPAIGWTMQEEGSKLGFGFGLIAIAGFRTDYPEDPASIAFAQPPAGFGRIYTDHRVVKIPAAVSYQANDKLALGLSVNIYAGELAIAPLPWQVFDVVGDDDSNRFYAQGDGLDLSFAWSIQPAFFYEVSDLISVGGSLTTEQDFAEFRWNSTFAHPDDPNYGKHRRLGFDLDGPMNVTMGVGMSSFCMSVSKLSTRTSGRPTLPTTLISGNRTFSKSSSIRKEMRRDTWNSRSAPAMWSLIYGSRNPCSHKAAPRILSGMLRVCRRPSISRVHWAAPLSPPLSDRTRIRAGPWNWPCRGRTLPSFPA